MMGHQVAIGLLLMLCLGSAIGLVASEHHSRALLDEESILTRQEGELELEWQQLMLEQSAITAKNVVHDIARSKLNMVEPEPTDVIYIRQ